MVRLKQIFIISLSTLFIIGCNSQSNNIKINKSSMNWHLTNIPGETGSISFDYEFNNYFIVDSLTGFMIGDNSGTELHNSVVEGDRSYNKANYETVLFKTLDGGLSFEKSTLGKGTLKQIVSDTKKNLYVIKKTYATDSIPQKYSILKSKDVGITWQEISNFNDRRIVSIQFYNALRGIACVEKKGAGVQSFKTIDGGATWQELKINKKSVDIYDMIFKGENELYTFNETTDLRQTASVNFTTGEATIYHSNLPKDFVFSSFIRDEKTDVFYSQVYNYEKNHELMLYNHTTQKLVSYDLKNHDDETIVAVNISESYIGVLRQDNGKTYYYYSADNGNNWMKESLPDYLADARPVALYGKGLVWVKSIRNLYNLQVRKSSVVKN